ncbi:TetR/AcrR family transcriptional regulator [Streptomyces himalayensis]|uniref:TetR/AcrR family transcriptional regulator n=1 Tax=Streptomyces himalayensis subsp. himalayensis TaxID=2756131 RepID=A0A7W0DU67_9ACTN|nr:TetR/AcrR family transcriptional regulator [Streptomyces himalayensis]MBA2951346.1 TetR/AcrR family transcriptional regulator [Streptomyces himalayensis subsp. himalayensis]
MTAPRRMGTENSKTRLRLLDITERLMLEEGYAAVGVRRVAREAEVAPALVLYYFRTLDDLFLAVLRRRADEEWERQARLLSGPQPLRALWRLSSHPGNALTTEFTALANHRKTIRAELAAHAARYREAQLQALTRGLAEAGTDLPPEVSPAVLLMLTNALGRILMMENAMGMTTRHEEALAFVEQILQRYEGATAPAETPRG